MFEYRGVHARPVASERTDGGTGEPAASPLRSLLPAGRIRPGTAVCAGLDMPLLLALAAEASAAVPGWAAVGLPHLGALAADAAGLDLACGMRIDDPGRQWAHVLATLLEAVPTVLVGPMSAVPDRVARRLSAVMRRSGSVLLAAGSWPGAEVQMRVVSATWEGVGSGHGLLHARRVRVEATGRGAAAAPRHADMWLPSPDGAAAPLHSLAGERLPAVSPPAEAAMGERRPALRVVG
ncbi:hypothetical protein ACF09G_31385 [Streptomyces albogriseolus]|uniref:hypothetical protein n=1 Tax=Streptomyces albogriseolus TaxID=1887 RepID=UPI0036F638F3